MKTWLRIATLLWISACLGACATGGKHTIPRNGPTIAQIYEGATGTSSETAALRQQRAVHGGSTDLAGYTRSAETELRQLFPRVPNPTLVMYVYPHLASGMPVPGYSTAFPMYGVEAFALPGEEAATDIDPSNR